MPCAAEGSLWTNVKRAMRSSWPVGFLLRHVLETYDNFSYTFSNYIPFLLGSFHLE